MLPASLTPDLLRQLELLKLRSRRAFLGTRQGGHTSPKRGHGIEFADYRQYELGDNPRHIDWGLYARSDRLYVKRFQEEQDLSVLLVIDTSASMHISGAAGSKWTRSCEIALGIAYVALMSQDSVAICAPGLFYSPRYHGARAIHQIARDLKQLSPLPSIDLVKGIRRGAMQIRFPGIAILISDFLMPLDSVRSIANCLLARNLEITAVRVLSPEDLNPLANLRTAYVEDCETGERLEVARSADALAEYSHLLDLHTKDIQSFLSERGIGFLNSSTTDDLAKLLIHQIPRTGLLR